MYATSCPDDVFHLLAESEDKTLCGMTVVPIIINRPAQSSTLYLTEVRDANRRLCHDCALVERGLKEKK